jgi:hypothetical protein
MGATIEQLKLLLGHEEIDQTIRYIDLNVAILRRAFEDVI